MTRLARIDERREERSRSSDAADHDAARLAEEIIRCWRPLRVHAPGDQSPLAAALWQRGVEVVHEADGQAASDLTVWLQAADEEGLAATAAAAQRMLFSPAPQGPPLLVWLRRFEAAGLAPQAGFDAGFAGPSAVLLERGKADAAALQTAVEMLRLRALAATVVAEAERARRAGAARSREWRAEARDALVQARDRARAAEAARRALQRQLEAIEASSFWRGSERLRRFLTAHPRLRTLLVWSVKSTWWTLTWQWPARLAARRAFFAAQEAAAAPSTALAAPPAARPGREPPPRSQAVDIIVCVHNALDDVQRCLASVLVRTAEPYRLIIVDDGSQPPTRDYLAAFAAEHGATLVRNDEARGYTFAANQGMREAASPWLVLLNSDTIVTDRWLDRMVDYGTRDPKVGVIGPLSNTASWQSVPAVIRGGDWAENPLPPGVDVDEMGRLVAQASTRQGAPLPFVNGFCLVLRKAMLDEIGLFDEATFGAGYGEENDLCIRARDAGWDLIVADDAYVFHAQSKSYSHERRHRLAARAAQALEAKHGAAKIDPQAAFCRLSPTLAGARGRVEAAVERRRLIIAGRKRWAGRRLAVILPVEGEGGGANVILQEIEALDRMGVETTILNLSAFRAGFEKAYPQLAPRTLYTETGSKIAALAADPVQAFDAVMATYYRSVEWLPRESAARLAYYIQDYEPLFFAKGDPEFETATRSYVLRPDAVLVTKTRWNADEVELDGARRPVILGPSVDVDLFRPGPRAFEAGGRPVRVSAMVRPSTLHRAPGRTMDVLAALKARFGEGVEIAIFGAEDVQLARLGLVAPGITNLGRLGRVRVAGLLERSDVFLDLSDYQAMGLTALEAMASGCAVVLPVDGGAGDFACDEENALLVDTWSDEACLAAAERLVADHALRAAIQAQAAQDACAYPPEAAAFRLMDALFGHGDRAEA